jgi:hypothetical protein
MGSLMHARAAAALRCDRSGLTLTHSCQCGRIRRTNKLRPYLARQPRPNLSCEGGMKTHNVSSHRRRRVWWCLARRLPIRSYGDGDGNLFAKTAEHTPGRTAGRSRPRRWPTYHACVPAAGERKKAEIFAHVSASPVCLAGHRSDGSKTAAATATTAVPMCARDRLDAGCLL